MSELNLEHITVIPMPIEKDYYILCRNEDDHRNYILTCMTYLTDAEEEEIDNRETIVLSRGNREFVIEPKNIYCYGHVDFSVGSSDCEIIEDFDFLNFLHDVGLKIYSDYDYEKHECRSPIGRCRVTETWNPVDISRYAYACLDKPNKIVLFKHIITLEHGRPKYI